MLTSVPNAIGDPTSANDPATGPAGSRGDRSLAPRRIDGVAVRLRRLVDSSEPAVVFSSLVRLCVPTFSDACWVDIVEGGRVRYRVTYPQPTTGTTPPLADPERSVVTPFESDLPGWSAYTGVMTSVWHGRPSTTADAECAAAIVDHAIRMICSERLADPVRSRLASDPARNALRSQLRSC